MYEMPLLMDHTGEVQPIAQVSTIKNFLQSCVKLMNDQSSIKVLQNMLERCNTEVEGKLEKKRSITSIQDGGQAGNSN
jgi:hypothetical protein